MLTSSNGRGTPLDRVGGHTVEPFTRSAPVRTLGWHLSPKLYKFGVKQADWEGPCIGYVPLVNPNEGTLTWETSVCCYGGGFGRWSDIHLSPLWGNMKKERRFPLWRERWSLCAERRMSATDPPPTYATFARRKICHILRPEKTLMPLSKTYCGKSVIFPHRNKASGAWIMSYRDGKPLPLPHDDIPATYKVCKVCKSRTPAQ